MRLATLLAPEAPPPPPGDRAFAAFTLLLALFVAGVASVDFVPVLDHINLAFHEVGHLVFTPFGAFLHYLGGTIGQFVFPTVLAIRSWRRGQPLAAAAAGVWWCENLRYTAAYVADARAQALPLVGGGEHDWTWLLSYLGLLEYDTSIAAVLVAACWLGIGAIWLALARWWWRGRAARAEAGRRQHLAAIAAAARERARDIERRASTR